MSNGLTLVSLLAGCFRGFFFSEQAWLTLLCLYVTVNTQPVSTPCWQEHSVWSVWRMHEQGTSICILAWVIAPYPGKWHLRIDVVAMKYVSLVQGCKSRSSGSNHLPYHIRHPVWAWGLQRLICMVFDANLTARGSNSTPPTPTPTIRPDRQNMNAFFSVKGISEREVGARCIHRWDLLFYTVTGQPWEPIFT